MKEKDTRAFVIKNRVGMYSKGRISTVWDGGAYKNGVLWTSNTGKKWVGEANVRKHLLKALENKISIDGWEIIEIIEKPTQPISEWVTEKMLVAVLKINQGEKK